MKTTARIAGNVALADNVQIDLVPPSGKTWVILEIAAWGISNKFEARVIWDVLVPANQEYLFNTDVPHSLKDERQIVGDGVKKLRLYAKNSAQTTNEVIGLSIIYEEINT